MARMSRLLSEAQVGGQRGLAEENPLGLFSPATAVLRPCWLRCRSGTFRQRPLCVWRRPCLRPLRPLLLALATVHRVSCASRPPARSSPGLMADTCCCGPPALQLLQHSSPCLWSLGHDAAFPQPQAAFLPLPQRAAAGGGPRWCGRAPTRPRSPRATIRTTSMQTQCYTSSTGTPRWPRSTSKSQRPR